MNQATVIIPTTGADTLKKTIESVLKQTVPTTCYVIVDGKKYWSQTQKILADFDEYAGDELYVCQLPLNVGANGFYGHRVYAAFTHLIDTTYVSYLDQDNWLEPNHIESCLENIKTKNLDWCYSLRKICEKDGTFACNDDCESLGKWKTYHGVHHIDTNCYFIKTEVAIRLASAWHGGWGQDRVFLQAIATHFNNFDCTGEYTVNYRVDGGTGSVTKEFFENGNKIMRQHYNDSFPWSKRK